MDYSMITDSIWVLLFGMAGIFAVMVVIMITVSILNRFSRSKNKEKAE